MPDSRVLFLTLLIQWKNSGEGVHSLLVLSCVRQLSYPR